MSTPTTPPRPSPYTSDPYPCKSLACAIQACLIKSDYDQAKCFRETEAFEACCRRAREEGNEKAREACGYVWRKWGREGTV